MVLPLPLHPRLSPSKILALRTFILQSLCGALVVPLSLSLVGKRAESLFFGLIFCSHPCQFVWRIRSAGCGVPRAGRIQRRTPQHDAKRPLVRRRARHILSKPGLHVVLRPSTGAPKPVGRQRICCVMGISHSHVSRSIITVLKCRV